MSEFDILKNHINSFYCIRPIFFWRIVLYWKELVEREKEEIEARRLMYEEQKRRDDANAAHMQIISEQSSKRTELQQSSTEAFTFSCSCSTFSSTKTDLIVQKSATLLSSSHSAIVSQAKNL